MTTFRCYTIGCLRPADRTWEGVRVCERCHEELVGETFSLAQLFRPAFEWLKRRLSPAERRERAADSAGRWAVARTLADTAPDPDVYLDDRDEGR